MNKAFRFRIIPNKEQINQINDTFDCTRFIYNEMLGDRIKYYEKHKKSLKNTPAMYKGKFPWLKEVDSLALCNAQINLNRAFTNFFKYPNSGFPKFKSKKKAKLSYTTNYVNGNIRIEDKYIILPKLKKVRIKLHRQIPKGYKIKSVTIDKSPTIKYHASILCEYDEDIKEIDIDSIENVVGLDFSMGRLYVSSDYIDCNHYKYYLKSLEKIKRLSRELSHCKKGSNNYKKKKMKPALLHEKVKNLRKDHLYKVSRQIANAYDMVSLLT